MTWTAFSDFVETRLEATTANEASGVLVDWHSGKHYHDVRDVYRAALSTDPAVEYIYLHAPSIGDLLGDRCIRLTLSAIRIITAVTAATFE